MLTDEDKMCISMFLHDLGTFVITIVALIGIGAILAGLAYYTYYGIKHLVGVFI